jgi:hypothetical protein
MRNVSIVWVYWCNLNVTAGLNSFLKKCGPVIIQDNNAYKTVNLSCTVDIHELLWFFCSLILKVLFINSIQLKSCLTCMNYSPQILEIGFVDMSIYKIILSILDLWLISVNILSHTNWTLTRWSFRGDRALFMPECDPSTNCVWRKDFILLQLPESLLNL